MLGVSTLFVVISANRLGFSPGRSQMGWCPPSNYQWLFKRGK